MNFDIGLEKASLEVSIHKDQKLRYTMQTMILLLVFHKRETERSIVGV